MSVMERKLMMMIMTCWHLVWSLVCGLASSRDGAREGFGTLRLESLIDCL
jgi:hypothetical protein